MTIWDAVWWGAFSSAALFLGQALAGPLEHRPKVTGLLMGFGAGTMLSAVAYELVPESSLRDGKAFVIGFTLGALTYYGADRLVDKGGGDSRIAVDTSAVAQGSGAAMFLGALLDGVPEAFVLGSGIALGGSVSLAFVVAVFVSNIPQGAAGTLSLLQAGTDQRRIATMWGLLTMACAAAAAGGFALANTVPDQGDYAQAFAAGAILVMLSDSMMPEAFRHGGRSVGLLTVLGFAVAAALTVAQ